jgi:hypothetical protein
MEIKYNDKTYTFDIDQAIKSGILKKKDGKVTTVHELTNKYRLKNVYTYDIIQNHLNQTTLAPAWNLAYQLTPEDAEALGAISLLLKFRRDWVGDWDWWKASTSYYIVYQSTTDRITNSWGYGLLTFPTSEMAEEFSNTFPDLLNKCKHYL